MIAALRGRILEKTPTRIVIDVQGVGYEVHVPLSTYYDLGDEGGEAALRVYTHVREDALQLFGFLTDLERQMFERLISVSGIGPKLAVAVLSGLETRDLVAAVQRADVARLITIPGVGKKTAERIVLELKDRLMPLAVLPTQEAAPTGPDRQRADLVSALQNLGYHRPEAEKAVDVVLAASPDAPFESALRNTLAELMKR
jgi:Holliday junction DNA helicase RuvA